MNKSLAKECATRGVLVNAVTPAVARTAMFEQMTQAHIDYMLGKIPTGRFVETDEIAAMVTWLSSEECSFSTGVVFDLTGAAPRTETRGHRRRQYGDALLRCMWRGCINYRRRFTTAPNVGEQVEKQYEQAHLLAASGSRKRPQDDE